VLEKVAMLNMYPFFPDAAVAVDRVKSIKQALVEFGVAQVVAFGGPSAPIVAAKAVVG
jgi:hypothetical protein